MAIYLRKASKGRWHPREEYGCEEGDVPPDPLADLRTKGNKLSVWLIEGIEEDEEVNGSSLVRRVVAALSATLYGLDDVYYILISGSILKELDIEVIQSNGQTPDREANKQWHYDLHIRSAQSLLELADALLGAPRLVLRAEIKKYLQEGLDSGWLRQKSLNRRILIELGIIKSGDCPNCGEPLGSCSNCGEPVEF